jgi:ubiquitin-protein ligase
MNFKRRLANEIMELQLYNDNYLCANNKLFCYVTKVKILEPETSYNNIIYCNIEGPINSPFANGIFQLSIKIPNLYPFEKPIFKFITPIYHPNLYSENYFTIIGDWDWTPSMDIKTLLILIYNIMAEPTFDYTCNVSIHPSEIETQILYNFKNNYFQWKKQAHEWTSLYAMPSKWNIINHNKFLTNKIQSKVIYLLWLGKQFSNNIGNALIDPWVMNIMPHIIGLIMPEQLTIKLRPGISSNKIR